MNIRPSFVEQDSREERAMLLRARANVKERDEIAEWLTQYFAKNPGTATRKLKASGWTHNEIQYYHRRMWNQQDAVLDPIPQPIEVSSESLENTDPAFWEQKLKEKGLSMTAGDSPSKLSYGYNNPDWTQTEPFKYTDENQLPDQRGGARPGAGRPSWQALEAEYGAVPEPREDPKQPPTIEQAGEDISKALYGLVDKFQYLCAHAQDIDSRSATLDCLRNSMTKAVNTFSALLEVLPNSNRTLVGGQNE